MKMSLCQMITFVCILAIGFMTVTPFVPRGHTDGTAHEYISGSIDLYNHHYCLNGHLLSVSHISNEGIELSTHEDGEPHKGFTQHSLIAITNSGQACSICYIVYLPHITSD